MNGDDKRFGVDFFLMGRCYNRKKSGRIWCIEAELEAVIYCFRGRLFCFPTLL